MVFRIFYTVALLQNKILYIIIFPLKFEGEMSVLQGPSCSTLPAADLFDDCSLILLFS